MWLPLDGRTEALIRSGKVPDVSMRDCQRNYRKALEKGVLKILSKNGHLPAVLLPRRADF